MSPVSPVLHTAAIMRIGLKTQSEWELPFHKIRCLFGPDYFHVKCNSQRCLFFYLGTRVDKRRIPDQSTGTYLNNNGEQN